MRTRSAALDGLRGLAPWAVLAHHAGWMAGGWLGVDLFFALSGWVIAGATHHPQYGERRVVRILPSALVVALVACAVTGAWRVLGRLPVASLWPTLDPGDARSADAVTHGWGGLAPLPHYWTLSVELLWYAAAPAWVSWTLRNVRASGALVLAWWALASVLRARGLGDVYAAPWWHAPTILGAAWLRLHGRPALPALARYAWAPAVTLVVLMIVPADLAWSAAWQASAVALVAGVASGGLSWLACARRMGDLSFPLYLVHLPVLTLAPGPMWARVAASCVAAFALWAALDRHCARGLAGLGLRTRRAVVA